MAFSCYRITVCVCQVFRLTDVALSDVSKTYGLPCLQRWRDPAVAGLTATIGERECFGFLGANGSGKTTVFDVLTGRRIVSEGTASIGGYEVTRNSRQVCGASSILL